MIYDLDEILSEKLTSDKTVEAVESNYRGLIKVKGIERDIEQERLIKLNRLERKEEPQEVKTDCLGGYCPKCSRRITEEVENYCTRCGQRLKFIEDANAIDEESGIPHYKHCACNLAFICEMLKERGADNA